MCPGTGNLISGPCRNGAVPLLRPESTYPLPVTLGERPRLWLKLYPGCGWESLVRKRNPRRRVRNDIMRDTGGLPSHGTKHPKLACGQTGPLGLAGAKAPPRSLVPLTWSPSLGPSSSKQWTRVNTHGIALAHGIHSEKLVRGPAA